MNSVKLSGIGREIFEAEMQRRRVESEITGKELVIPLLPKELLISGYRGKGKTLTAIIPDEVIRKIKKAIADGERYTRETGKPLDFSPIPERIEVTWVKEEG